MKPGDLTKWQAAGGEIQLRHRLDLLGVDHPLVQAVIDANLEIDRQKAIWAAARLRLALGRLRWPATFDGRQN